MTVTVAQAVKLAKEAYTALCEECGASEGEEISMAIVDGKALTRKEYEETLYGTGEVPAGGVITIKMRVIHRDPKEIEGLRKESERKKKAAQGTYDRLIKGAQHQPSKSHCEGKQCTQVCLLREMAIALERYS